MRQGAPIYTVHENFITTPPYVRIVPDIYTKVFINMGSPLKIINELISLNLIKPPIQDIQDFTPLYYHNNDNPMPSNYLTDLLNSLFPTLLIRTGWTTSLRLSLHGRQLF